MGCWFGLGFGQACHHTFKNKEGNRKLYLLWVTIIYCWTSVNFLGLPKLHTSVKVRIVHSFLSGGSWRLWNLSKWTHLLYQPLFLPITMDQFFLLLVDGLIRDIKSDALHWNLYCHHCLLSIPCPEQKIYWTVRNYFVCFDGHWECSQSLEGSRESLRPPYSGG